MDAESEIVADLCHSGLLLRLGTLVLSYSEVKFMERGVCNSWDGMTKGRKGALDTCNKVKLQAIR